MPRYRLRYQSTDLELRPGEFVIGRSTASNLALDDALVSRRHALIHVTADSARIEDLGSRNGVRVNGTKIEGSQALRHLDRIAIGSQEMLVLDADAEATNADDGAERCERCGAAASPRDPACRECGAPLRFRRPTLDQATVEFRLPSSSEAPGGAELGAFALVSGIANKALAMGRIDEAERMLAPFLDGLLTRANDGTAPSTAQLRDATDFALKLAEGSNGARWVAFLFGLHTAAKRLPETETVDRLYELVRRTRFNDVKALQRYLDVLALQTAKLTAADRFLVKRLEGLLRIIAA